MDGYCNRRLWQRRYLSGDVTPGRWILMIRIRRMPDGIDRPGLQPSLAITEAQAIADAGTVTDACGTVDVTAVADAPATNTAGCKWTQTWTVTATDACGNDATCQVTHTGRWMLTIRNSPHARRHRST
ncbi:MAG: hypothetical protein IPK76_19585 [Lewinellaceae bacterium]|nr:hypothetical protein [Lewinellaceae bacterium]